MEININQTISITKKALAIYIIGAGVIVKDAHLPAYKKARFTVAGIYEAGW